MVNENLKNSPKISVIVPCYNTEKYLEKCLNSLVQQTFTNFEVICIDDGSTDSTLNIINAFTDIDKRFKLIKQTHEGPSKARNEGLKISKGEYISFVDSDDWIDKDFLEKLLISIEKNSCDISASTIIRTGKYKDKYRVNYTEEKIYYSLQDKIKIAQIPKCCYVWNKLYRYEKIKNYKFKEGVFYEDMLWLPEVIKNTDKFVTVPNTNYYYRRNSLSIVKKKPDEKKQSDYYESKKFILNYFEENKLELNNKYKKITKKIYYLFNIPIIKVKEYKNTDIVLLFGIITIFRKKHY